VRGLRSAAQQRAELAAGPLARIALKQPAGRQHHRDHRASQHLAKRQRTRQRQQRNHVHTRHPPDQLAPDRHRQRHQRHYHRQR